MSRARIIKSICVYCGKEYYKWGKAAKYCSEKCANNNKKDMVYYKWQQGEPPKSFTSIRRILLQRRKNICSKCRITEWNGNKISLEVHHIDGDWKNNQLSNLMLLCPNCHSLTNTYKSKNKGKGRPRK